MKIILFLLGLALNINIGLSQNKSFELNIQNDTVLMGNYIIAEFSIINTDGDFEAPKFKDWYIVSGPNISSIFIMANGNTTKQSCYTYYLKPKKEGILMIEPAYLFNDTDTLETVPQTVLVLPNPEGKIIEPKQHSNNMFHFSLPNENGQFLLKNRKSKIKNRKKKLKTRKL